MEGVIVNYRRGRHRQKTNHIIIETKLEKEKAENLIGKQLVWKSPKGKEIKGKITSLHGNKGCVRAIFEKGLPGQALGSKIEIID